MGKHSGSHMTALARLSGEWELRSLTMGSRMTQSRPTGKLSAVLLAAATLIPAAACSGQGVAERAGEVLDNAGRSIRRGVEGAVVRGQTAVREQDVFTRVYSRIHWDKVLVGSVLELEVRADGMAILRGSVPDAAATETGRRAGPRHGGRHRGRR